MKNLPINGNPDVLQRIYQLLDDQDMTPETERAMLDEIKTNPKYRELFAQEDAFREFIRSRIHRRKVSPSLVQSIKDKIRSQQ